MSDRAPPDRKKLRRAKNAVRGAFNKPKAPYFEAISRYGKAKLSPSDLILGGLSQLPPNEAGEFLEWMKGFPSKALHIYPIRPIQNPMELALVPVTISLPILIRLNWLSTLLEKSLTELTSFVDLAAHFERNFLVGAFEDAQTTLDTIKATFGLSVWLIETQIALLQRWKGLDAQKEYARSISGSARGRLAGVTAYWVSQRNEENTVFARFCTRLERRINDWKVTDSLRDAYSVILGVTSFHTLPDQRASSTLGTLATPSLIDAYTATLLALQTIFMRPQWSEATQVLQAIVSRLPQTDTRIRNMAALITANFSALEKASTTIVDGLCRAQPVTASPSEYLIDASTLADHAQANALLLHNAPLLPWRANSPADDLFQLVAASISRHCCPVDGGYDFKVTLQDRGF